MASTIEPCESKPAGLATLSSTLEMFDTFKPSQDEDRDSDEESFHLPMLGCDDDMDINNKETSGMASPNPETEDDILNKFETAATPDIDPKLEDVILDDDTDDTCEKSSAKFDEISNQMKNKDKKNSTISTECEGEMKVDENETGIDVSETLETKIASETDENTDGSEVFKDLEIVDELNESFEEKGDENTNEEVRDIVKKTIIEMNKESECMEVDTVEAEEESPVENIQDTGEAHENVICDLKETEDMSITKTKLDKSEETVENVTEMALSDENIENSHSDSVMPGDSVLDDDLSSTDKSTVVAMVDENIEPENISQIGKSQEENRVENSNEESKMTCDDEEDEIINGIVKEVNEKLDSDEDEMMAENSDLQKSSTKETTSTSMSIGNRNNDEVEECAELEEINSSSRSNKADNNVVNKQDVTQTSLDQDENIQDDEMSKTEAVGSFCKNTKTVLDSADDLHERDDKNNKIDEGDDDSKPMDIDISMDEEDNIIPVPNSKEHEKASENDSETRFIEPPTTTTGKIVNTAEVVESTPIVESTPVTDILDSTSTTEFVEITPTAEIVESTPRAEIVESTPTAEIVESTPTAEIVESTPTAEIVESTPTAEIVESTPTSEIMECSPTAEIVERRATTEIEESTATTVIEESTPTSGIVKSTTSTDIAKNQFLAQMECTETALPIKSLPLDANKDENTESSKIDKSYDSTNSLECDDLLDVSIIRDVDEDNATAIAENSNDIQSSEKSDNDDQDDDKADNEMDESEPDQDDILLSSDKDDHIDSEEGNSNSCDQTTVDNLMSENTSDGETKGDDDVVMKESEESKSNSSQRMEVEFNSTSEKSDPKEKSVDIESQEKIKENGVQLGKRTFAETYPAENQVTCKKFRLSPESKFEEKGKTSVKNSQMKTLLSFEKFMQDRKFGSKKLTRSDLEQFCLQKICEAIVHKTDVGELHQTVKKQEIIIENLRKDLQQLTKQTRDLDIVNKKLMNELKMQNGNKKPLVPLKITRSVGLQVKLNIGVEPAARRKQPIIATTPSRTPSTPSTSSNTPVNRPRNITPANSGVVRQVNQNSTPATTNTLSPRKPQPTTPILSQALQTRQTPPLAKRTPMIRPKPVEPAKAANPGVIDLTDEDDKTSKTAGTAMKIPNKPPTPKTNLVQNKNLANKMANGPASTASKVAGQASKVAGPASKVAGQATKVMNKVNKTQNNQNKPVTMAQVKAVGSKPGTQARTVTTLPQGVRLTSTHLKNGLAIPANVVTSNASGTTQYMYVVQPSSLVTSTAGGTQKAVLLNFQPTNNGVLASTINGSAVSVIPSKTPNNVQLKSITPRKHPASLPLPPSVPQNPSLKQLLPKPHLSIRKTDTGIILQWRMPYNLDNYEGIASYQLFAYQETNAPPSTDMWRKVGDVKALALPMACTLTQFADKNKYYFAVRSVDVHKRIGAFSDPEEISL